MAEGQTQANIQEAPPQHGSFVRKASEFRDLISADDDARFPAEKDRYVLYMNYGCPWAHRVVLVRSLKGLDDIIQMVCTDYEMSKDGWAFTGHNGSPESEPLYGFKNLKQLYLKANPDYAGKYTTPCLWDKHRETIVNNESGDIMRMFYSEFDGLLPPEDREIYTEGGGFYPEGLRNDIDEMNEWVYNTINNGVYKCGFATSQAAYDAAIHPLFQSLDRLESHLANTTRNNSVSSSPPLNTSSTASNRGGPFLFGPYITEADLRLFPTLIRFDAAYHTIFRCNLKSIRHDYPCLNRWLKTLYWGIAPGDTNTIGTSSTNPFTNASNTPLSRKASINFSRRASRRASSTSGFQAFKVPAYPIAPASVHENENENDLPPIATAMTTIIAATPPQTIFQRTTDFEAYRRGLSKAVAGLRAREAAGGSDNVVVPRGPLDGIETLSENENGAGGANRRQSLQPDYLVGRPEAHQSENRKWYEAAKQVERDAGGAMLHLASS